jgi:hypothetical protein
MLLTKGWLDMVGGWDSSDYSPIADTDLCIHSQIDLLAGRRMLYIRCRRPCKDGLGQPLYATLPWWKRKRNADSFCTLTNPHGWGFGMVRYTTRLG